MTLNRFIPDSRQLTAGLLMVLALFLAACGSRPAAVDDDVSEPGDTVAEAAPDQTAPDPAAETNDAAASESLEPAPALAPGSGADDGIMLGDDRPGRLRALTASWNTNWERHTINYEEILSGGPPRDGIPSIDNPQFVSVEEASLWLAGNEPVMVVDVNGDVRAYPLQILTWHEIVNDTVGDVPVVVTFCPLCNSALVFERSINGQVVEFGTSGLLRNSDLIMYDRSTETLWQQLTGEGIVGDLAGEQLTFLPAGLVSFANFRAAHPDGLVLSQETGFSRSYGRNPYVGYDAPGQFPFLFDGEMDNRLPAMVRVVSVAFTAGDGAEVAVAYPLPVLQEMGVINDTVAGRDLAVFHVPGTSSALGDAIIATAEDVGATGVFDPNVDGQKLTFVKEGRRIVDEQTGSTWNILGQAIDGPLSGERLTRVVSGDHFWFSWAAFEPDTIVYQP